MKMLLAISISILALTACDNQETGKQVEASGLIEGAGITSYQYGSHIITTEEGFYALTSEEINLTNLEGAEVTIVGEKIEGYPVDGGPEYLKVLEVKQ